MKGKKIIGIIVALLLVVCATVIIITMINGKESYRLIKIYEFDGDGSVTRESVGKIEPYNNMVLESGDKVKLNQGLMNLKLDEDKYVYVEEGTEFTLLATGTEDNSKTTIELEKGAITSDIQKKLNGESSYEINTPNVTVSVRGTKYRVDSYQDDAGATYSRVSVFEGTVASKLVFADGTVAEEVLDVEAGKEITIKQDDSATDYIGEPTDIDYSTLPEYVGGEMDNATVGTATDGEEEESSEETAEERMESDLTDEELHSINVFATYLSTTQAGAAEAVEGMTLQLSDEVVMNMIGILANDYMGVSMQGELAPYVIYGTHEAGYMSITKDDIDQYVADVFGYTGIENYEMGNVMAGANGYEIWEHQGFCDTTVTINDSYIVGENYVIEGVANLNYSDIFDPMFMDAEFTFTVRRNSDSPFGFTYVDFVFGTVTK